MTINILILNWNSAESTQQCLNSIACSDDKEFRVILIDNFSTKKEIMNIRDIYENFKDKLDIYLVENHSNLGYAGGNNQGLNYLIQRNLPGDLLIINPDILIRKNTISEMKKALTNDVGIVTVRTLNPQGKILYDAIQLKGFFQHNVITNQNIITTDFSQGSCLLIKRDIIDKIGLFDERFFLYWEEVDFSLRVKAQGYKLISITTTDITKNNNSESRQPDAFYYSIRNSKLIKDKHGAVFFTNSAHRYYLLKMFFLAFKFVFKPRLFLMVIANYFYAVHDSFLDIYYSKPINFQRR